MRVYIFERKQRKHTACFRSWRLPCVFSVLPKMQTRLVCRIYHGLWRLPCSFSPSLIVPLRPQGTIPAELVTTHPSVAAPARSLLAIDVLDAVQVRPHIIWHIRPVVNHVEVSVPNWPPAGRVPEVCILCLELIVQDRRVHRLAVDVLTIHPTREVCHVEFGG
jgi:hypothetical protein